MSTNPNYEIKKQIDDVVVPKFEYNSVLKYFPSQKIGDGKQVWERKFAVAPRIPLAQNYIEKLVPQALQTANGKYNLPRVNLSVSLTEDEYAQRLGAGELPGHMSVLAMTMAKAVDKIAYQGKSYASGEVQCYSLTDNGTGNGTNDRPLVTVDGTKKGSWATATYAGGDFGTLTGGLDPYPEFDGPRLLLRPSVSMPAFKQLVPGLYNGEFIEDMAARVFTAMHKVGLDDPPAPGATALSLLTGEAETLTAFELFCVNPLCFTWVYDTPPFTNLIHDQIGKRWIYEMEVHGALIPTVLAEDAGKTYKALSKIDSCNG